LTDLHEHRFVIAALAVALGTAGCANTRPGDPPSTPPADELGTGQRISSVLGGFFGPAPWVQPTNLTVNCPDPADVTVLTTGVTVSAVDTWDETGNGAVGTVYVQDTVPAPAPHYAGMALFEPTFSPPNLKVLPGDVVDVAGLYEEYIGPATLTECDRFCYCETLPQLGGAVTPRYTGTVPEPVVLTPEDLDTYANARQYLGMLVTVTNVTIATTGDEDDGRYSAPVQLQNVPPGSVVSPWSIDDELWDVYRLMPLSANQCFASVTGIVTFFESFSLAPRSAADFVPCPVP
jgi:hypothetical protein